MLTSPSPLKPHFILIAVFGVLAQGFVVTDGITSKYVGGEPERGGERREREGEILQTGRLKQQTLTSSQSWR